MTDFGAAEVKAAAERLSELLRLRTLPFGLKLFEDADEMMAVPGIRTPMDGIPFTTCQLVTQVRTAGFTLGVVKDNLRPNASCGANIGLEEVPEALASGEQMNGVWFGNQEPPGGTGGDAARPRPYSGLCASPLRSGRLDPPDICLFYASPGQMILFINGLQYDTYERYDFNITGERLRDSWGRRSRRKIASRSLLRRTTIRGCRRRRASDGLSSDEFLRGVAGLEHLSKNGLRYPYPPFGAFADPAIGMARSYGGKKG